MKVIEKSISLLVNCYLSLRDPKPEPTTQEKAEYAQRNFATQQKFIGKVFTKMGECRQKINNQA